MKPITESQWHIRLARALELLSTRLDNPPPLAELAAAASISPYHFHRIWRGITGETVGETITRLRHSLALQLLRQGGSVTETATALGYATPQGFARAFRKHTGTTPGSMRAGTPEVASVTVTHLPAIELVATRRDSTLYIDLAAAFGAIWTWAEGQGHLARLQGIYEVPWDDALSVDAEHRRCDAGLALGPVTDHGPFHALLLPAGRFAVLEHRGSYDQLDAKTQALVGDWLADSPFEPADFPVIYEYLDDPESTPEPELRTRILLPLQGS